MPSDLVRPTGAVLGTISSTSGASEDLSDNDADNWTKFKSVVSDDPGTTHTITFSNIRAAIVISDETFAIQNRVFVHNRVNSAARYARFTMDSVDQKRALSLSGTNSFDGFEFVGRGDEWDPAIHRVYPDAGHEDSGQIMEQSSGTSAFNDCLFRDSIANDIATMTDPRKDGKSTTTRWWQHHIDQGYYQHFSHDWSANSVPGYGIPNDLGLEEPGAGMAAALANPTLIQNELERANLISWLDANDTAWRAANNNDPDGQTFRYRAQDTIVYMYILKGGSWYVAPRTDFIDFDDGIMVFQNCEFRNLGYVGIRCSTGTNLDIVHSYAYNCMRLADTDSNADNSNSIEVRNSNLENSSVGTLGSPTVNPSLTLENTEHKLNRYLAQRRRHLFKVTNTTALNFKNVRFIHETNDTDSVPHRVLGDWLVNLEGTCGGIFENIDIDGTLSLGTASTFTPTGHNEFGSQKYSSQSHAIWNHADAAGLLALDNCTFRGVSTAGVKRESTNSNATRVRSRAFTKIGENVPVYDPEGGGVPGIPAADYYVSSSGGTGAGTMGDPWSLTYALQDAPLAPGDIVELADDGTYTNPGTYTSGMDGKLWVRQQGTSTNPIVFRGAAGTVPKIDTYNATAQPNGLQMDLLLADNPFGLCRYVEFHGLEIFNSNPGQRWTTNITTGAPRGNITLERGMIFIQGQYNKIVNCVIHDLINGVSGNDNRHAIQILGNICYNIGFAGPYSLTTNPLRMKEHCIYMKNPNGPGAGSPPTDRAIVSKNVCFQASTGLTIYGAAKDIDMMTIEDNIQFDNVDREVLIGTESGAGTNDVIFNRNHLYTSIASLGPQEGMRFGWSSNADSGLETNDNYLHDVDTWWQTTWAPVTGTNNNVWEGAPRGPQSPPAGWSYSGSPPAGNTTVAVDTSTVHEPVRGFFGFHNHQGLTSIDADLDSIVPGGTTINIYHVFDLTTPVVASHTYSTGVPVSIPVNSSVTPPAYLGDWSGMGNEPRIIPTHTAPLEFGCYLIKAA